MRNDHPANDKIKQAYRIHCEGFSVSWLAVSKKFHRSYKKNTHRKKKKRIRVCSIDVVLEKKYILAYSRKFCLKRKKGTVFRIGIDNAKKLVARNRELLSYFVVARNLDENSS